MSTIKINETNKITSIRIREKTKKMLEAVAKGKETHEDIIQRLIKLSNDLDNLNGTKIVEKGNTVGTKYEQKNKTINIEIKDKKYCVVCVYNDLSIIKIMQKNQIQNLRSNNHIVEWELDLEIVNINKGRGWIKPSTLNTDEIRLIYLACVKQILQETFDIKLYELETEKDYLDIDKWTDVYNRNNLSRDSLNSDIKAAFKDIKEKLR